MVDLPPLDPRAPTQGTDSSNSQLIHYRLPRLPNFGPPALPQIRDAVLERKARTHSSAIAKKRDALSFKFSEDIMDYEKLEHVGDGILTGIVTVLLDKMYPNLPVGSATILKSLLVSNPSLAQISKHYGISSRIIASHSSTYSLENNADVHANLFEAHIAALYLAGIRVIRDAADDADSNTSDDNANEPGEIVIESTDGYDTPRETKLRAHAHGQVARWLRPQFRPLAVWAFEKLLKEQERLKEEYAGWYDDSDMDDLAVGATARLNENMIRFHENRPKYTATRSATDRWIVKCDVEDRKGRRL